MLVRVVLTLLGVIFVVLALNDVFQSVIVPRAVGRSFRVSHILWRFGWRLWPRLSFRIYGGNEPAREDFLALFAPVTLVVQLIVWSILVLVGFGMIFWASSHDIGPHPRTFWEAVYFAGTSYFTIGFGDYVGRSGWTRLCSLAAGAAGFGVVGTTTAFLFAIFGAFQSREQFVLTVGARAGTPPSGVALLVIAQEARIVDSLPVLMRSAQSWCALVMETHLAYPVLAYFRSSHDYQSWVGTLGTLLDAATLLLTTVQGDAGEARILYDIGRHASRDLSSYFRMPSDENESGLTREEFDNACEHLKTAGYALHDRAAAWERFVTLRRAYATHLDALAHYFSIPPLQWIGDRSSISPH
ncbi:MAG: two pore domain potassium channel family protein [Candidatus Eremiobacteraeota bacterium]|nr:two pore domain potassium channel family protein [Candidatus Eremiobacteraeota bacterium]